MKVLAFFSLAAVWRPRIPALLSVIQDHIDAGDQVVVISCDRSVRACTANLDHTRAICSYCIEKKRQGLALLEGDFVERQLDHFIDAKLNEALRESKDRIATVDDLTSLHYQTADIGYAAYSTYAYVARKAEPNLDNPIVARVIHELVNTGKYVFEAARNAIVAEKPDRVILHHGRGAMDRSVLRAAQAERTDCWIYETALGLDRLLCFKNALPHDIENFHRRVLDRWEAGGPDREEIGAAFYQMRRSGDRKIETGEVCLQTGDRPYVSRQEQGRMPDHWDDSLKNIVIYGSSNDEFIAISPEYEERLHPSQIDALDRLSRDLAGDDYHLWFRVHPRQKGVKDEYIAGLMELDASRENVSVVPADSQISSYSLLDAASIVVAFLSTVSIEATYWGKPSIIISASLYKPMGASYTPASHEELIELIRSDPAPRDKLPSLRFGHYQMTSGATQANYGGDLGKGRSGYTFRGDPILITGPCRWRYLWSRERQRLKWRKLV